MAEYVDLVICKKDDDEKPMLFRAPRFSGLKEGERVITENDLCLTVERSYSARTDDPYDELNFILHASGAELPLKKIVSRVVIQTLEYEEDEE